MYADPNLATILVGTEKHLFHLEEDQLCVQQGNEASRKGEIGDCIGIMHMHIHVNLTASKLKNQYYICLIYLSC